jgi:DNA topoisomerase IB
MITNQTTENFSVISHTDKYDGDFQRLGGNRQENTSRWFFPYKNKQQVINYIFNKKIDMTENIKSKTELIPEEKKNKISLTGNITFEDYSTKSFMIKGSDTQKHKDKLKELGGLWLGSGWLFRIKDKDKVLNYFQGGQIEEKPETETIKKKTETIPEENKVKISLGDDINYEEYTEKSFLIKGEQTKNHKDKLKELGGRWNAGLKGWLFANKNKDKVLNYFQGGQIEEDEGEEEMPVEFKKTGQQYDKTKALTEKEMKYCSVKKLVANARAEKWWENMDKNKSDIKWQTLKHNGVLFSPQYEPLPANVKILYNGKPVTLDSKNTDNEFNISEEEAAVFFANKIEQDERLSEKNPEREKSYQDKKFRENFWRDWKKILSKEHKITHLDKVDFTPIIKFVSQRSKDRSASNKLKTKEQKQQDKYEKEILKDLYGYAIVDDVKIPLGNYMVQPPAIFIGHGSHPLRGCIKARVKPQDIVLNVSRDNVPECFREGKPCRWGEVIEDKQVTWIASWRNPITQDLNYVWLKREASEWVCASDIEKFDKARKLGQNIEKVRTIYNKDLRSSKSETRQLATAVYLLDILAIRPGTEKDEAKEAGTLGLTTLKCSNIGFEKDNNITIDFIGKSSIHFNKTFQVEKIVYDNLLQLCSKTKNKNTSEIFPDVNAITLNGYLKTLLPGLTAKVFRTYKASSILEKELSQNIPAINTETHEKKLIYDRVNIEVAKALNHKKMGGSSQERLDKLKIKISEAKEKKKKSKTSKQKQAADKTIKLNEAKLEEAQFNISTSTSKVNYLDPRVTVSWCKQAQVPIEKIYNKTQLVKFIWAMETPGDWKF